MSNKVHSEPAAGRVSSVSNLKIIQPIGTSEHRPWLGAWRSENCAEQLALTISSQLHNPGAEQWRASGLLGDACTQTTVLPCELPAALTMRCTCECVAAALQPSALLFHVMCDEILLVPSPVELSFFWLPYASPAVASLPCDVSKQQTQHTQLPSRSHPRSQNLL